MDQNAMKKAAAEAALAYIEPGTVVGVGTGSTANYFIDALATLKDRIRGAVANGVPLEEAVGVVAAERAAKKRASR